MTTRLAPWCLSSLAALAGLVALAPRAEAQCLPGSAFCAQVSVGGSVVVGGYIDVAPPPPPPPVYVVQPPPPPVYIMQPPPPPPPPVVVYQPPQPVYQPPPVYYGGGYQQPPMMMQQRDPRFGVHLELGYMGADNISMGGGGVAARFRPAPAFALDLGVGTFGGSDYNGNNRVEVPLTLNGLIFFNPQDRVQVYGLVGIGVDWASVNGSRASFSGTDYTYFGGQLGIGVEWRLSRWFALNTDIRGFIRSRIDDGTSIPEFSDGSGRTTNTSMGVYGTLGATLYW